MKLPDFAIFTKDINIFNKNTSESATVNRYLNTRVSYSGCDMVATITVPQLGNDSGINPVFVIGELQTLSYSIHTEDKPVRSFSRKNIKAFTSGPRTIAGSLVFSVFNRHVFRNICEELVKKYTMSGLTGKKQSIVTQRILSDELPPFNITITFANEYGQMSSLTIYNVHIQDEGQVMSIDDIMTENTMSYFALDISLMEKIDKRGKRPSNSILNYKEEQTYGNKPKYGDYYVYGNVTLNGSKVPLELINTYDVSITCQDGLTISGGLNSDSKYFIYTATPPQKVDIIIGNEIIATSTSGKGHCWNINIV